MTTTQLIILYLVGWAACMCLGMRIEAWRWKNRRRNDLDKAYYRGWKAGHNFVGTIVDQKIDMESAVRILTGEELHNQEE